MLSFIASEIHKRFPIYFSLPDSARRDLRRTGIMSEAELHQIRVLSIRRMSERRRR